MSGAQLVRSISAGERGARAVLEAEARRLEVERCAHAAKLVATERAILRQRQQQQGQPLRSELPLPRQASQNVELELRVVGGAWESDDAPAESGGTLRCYADDSLHTIRHLAATQLPWLGTGYSFVRWGAQGRLCKLNDGPDDAHQFCARHFMPYMGGPGPGLLCVVFGRCYCEGEVLTAEETKTSEFKSLVEPQQRQGLGVLAVLKERKVECGGARFTLLEKYMCGFLNSQGGRILFGVSDAGAVEMVPLAGPPPSCRHASARRLEGGGEAQGGPEEGEAECARANGVKDAVRKLVDGVALHLSPPVDASLVRGVRLLLARSVSMCGVWRGDHHLRRWWPELRHPAGGAWLLTTRACACACVLGHAV